MPHIHTKPGQHDHTASGYIIRMDGGEPQLMLHKHKKTGKYQQFGGHIELDENPWQAVKHEILEESGYDMSQLKILQPKIRMPSKSVNKQHPVPVSHNTHNFSDDHFHTDLGYAFTTDQSPRHPVAKDESNEFMLVSRGELEKLEGSTVPGGIKEVGLFIFDKCLTYWEEIDPDVFDS